MLKALIAGKDKNICSAVLESVQWEKRGYAAEIAAGEKAALEAAGRSDIDVLIAAADKFPWKRLYAGVKSISGNVDVILICGNEKYETAKEALEVHASGIVLASELKGKRLHKILDEIYNRRQSSTEIAWILSDENASEQVYYEFNGNNILYFENLFGDLMACRADKEFIKAVCLKLIGMIYDYLENQGFKNAAIQRSSAIRRASEMTHISQIIQYTRDRYMNIFQFETEKNQDYYYVISESIKEYIKNNYSVEAIGVPKIAERFHFSANYVNGIFKEQTGETIPSYISNLRLNKARQLLVETGEPISEIAIKVGYSRPTYFSRIFKRKYNLSPIEYRNKFSKNNNGR